MTVTLHNRTYTLARDDSGPVVLIQHSNRGRASIWRTANVQDTLRVIAGLKLCPLKVVS